MVYLYDKILSTIIQPLEIMFLKTKYTERLFIAFPLLKFTRISTEIIARVRNVAQLTEILPRMHEAPD